MSRKHKRQIRRTSYQEGRHSSSYLAGRRSLEEEFNPDYTPIIKDLRRIGTLAGAFFIILIVLSFFLR